jgi:endoglucanase
MKSLLFTLLLCSVTPFIYAYEGTISLTVNGVARTCLFHSPGATAPSAASNLPLLIAMHGDGGSAANFKSYCGLDAVADANNFIVAYPNGQSSGASNTWNQYIDGTAGRPDNAALLDDLPFFNALMDYFEDTYGINCNKIYATGHSAGGFMAYYLAVAFPSRIAAIAPYAASMWYDTNDPVSNAYYNANFSPNVPVLHLHGGSDATVTTPNLSWPWPLMNYIQGVGCNPGNNINENLYTNLDGDSYYATSYRYNLNNSGAVCATAPYKHRLVIINTQGHGWPTQDTNEFNISNEIWAFCNQFQLNNNCNALQPPSTSIDAHIKTDQFGYLPNAQKIAVISNPINGYNNNQPFTPGSTTYRLRRVSDNITVYSNTLTAWSGGATHSQSGDQVWWFDFSNYTTEGDYYVWDSLLNKQSYPFTIGQCVYSDAMQQAFRTFYYQRCGVPKSSPFAQTGYTDAICHAGNLQDTNCRLYSEPNNAALAKDLSGGWHDAGDYNKYVNFTYQTLIDLLLGYAETPEVWADNWNIPESGNGVPDLLDEIKVELNWLLKMQQSNGGILSVVGVQNYASASPPSADNAQRFYGPATTSASFTAAAIFALAAIQFNAIGNTTYAATLQTAATNAYTWATNNPNITFYNTNIIASGENEVDSYERDARHLSAAVFLYALTANSTYRTYVDANYNNMHLLQWTYAYPYESALQDALLYYANLSAATTAVKNAIRNAYSNSISTHADNYAGYATFADAYRAYLKNDNYTWGSNQIKTVQGTMYQNMINYNLDIPNQSNYYHAAASYIHYLHGINPIGICYLSNMGNYNAEYSVREIYNGWFTDGSTLWDRVGVSTYGPAPGFLPGGASYQYALDPCCAGSCAGNALCNTAAVTPPLGQPIQKSYLEFNTSWPQNSWVVSENAIYTQAAYLRLLSKYACSACTFVPTLSGNGNVCLNTVHTYSTVPGVAGTTYNWVVNGGIIQSGQGSSSINVLWNNGIAGSVSLTMTTP